MGKRGVQPKGKVKIKWSPNFAYAIGLLVADGCLSKNSRHIDFTSKDIEQIQNFTRCLNLKVKVGTKRNGRGDVAYRVQFGDVLFYKFLEEIGITKAKSHTIGEIKVPSKYFFDFLRGCFDGDGCFYSYWDPRWRSSHMFYTTFSSASRKHVDWIRREIAKRLNMEGHISKSKSKGSIFNLRYAKKESLELIHKMYYNPKVVCLTRKREKIERVLETERKQQKKYT